MLRGKRPVRSVAIAFAMGAALVSTTCAAPTQVRVLVYSEADCRTAPIVGVVTGASLTELSSNAPSATSTACEAGTRYVGSIVLRPSDGNEDSFAFQVLTRPDGGAPDTCVAPRYEGCIVARRQLRFVPRETLEVRVDLRLSCLDKPCNEQSETCVHGRCLPAAVPGTCEGSTCDETALGGLDANGCPTGLGGPAMVRIAAPEGSYCIDATEVTSGQYQAFLDTNPTLGVPATLCSWNDSYEATVATDRDLPVTYVDWCDAFAYCASVGKRLCGRIGGGSVRLPADGPLNDRSSEWLRACSSDGREFPYGPTYEPRRCVGGEGEPSFVRVGTTAGCVSVPGLFDMSGNVHEWEDSCDDFGGDNRAQDSCACRGGSYSHPPGDTSCTARDAISRDSRVDDVGIRCCWPP